MAIYDAGTASLAADGTVIGVGTTWRQPLTLIRVGATMIFNTTPASIVTIAEIISDTEIRVFNDKAFTAPAGTQYSILAHDGITVQGLAQDVAETLRYYQSRETEVAAAVDAFNQFDADAFQQSVTNVNNQSQQVATDAAQVSSDKAAVSADKDSAAASAASAMADRNAAAASAAEAADSAASLNTSNLLRVDRDLSDLSDKAISRTNLDVYSKAEVDNLVSPLSSRVGFFAYPEDYQSDVVSGDWSVAIQKALDTGKPVYLSGSYLVSAIINSKGQKIYGPGKIATQRYGLDGIGYVSAASSDINVDKIKMIYLESAYDLSELLYIKSLGINCINHYCYFSNNGNIDSDGTVQKLLDNALTAGIGVNLGTESDAAKNNLAAFVAATKDHPSVIGYSVYDEPGARGISVADQNSKISQLRSLTDKSLSMVDQLPPGTGPFEQIYSTDYDIVLCNSYSLNRPGLSVSDAVEQDLIGMRLDYGGVMKMTGCSRVIPVVSSFGDNSVLFGTTEQTVIASKIFGQVGNGEFGAFVWDGAGDRSITKNVRNTQEFRDLIKSLANKKFVKPLVTEAYLFGGNANQKHWPLGDILDKALPVDRFTSDGLIANNAWPTRVVSGAADGDHSTSQAGIDMSGICFKRDGSIFATTIKCRTGFSAWVQMNNANGGASLSGNLYTGYTSSGYDGNLLTNTQIESGAPYKFGATRSLSATAKDNLFYIQFNLGSGTVDFYRNSMRGLLVFSDW